jgi:hypothetical protein
LHTCTTQEKDVVDKYLGTHSDYTPNKSVIYSYTLDNDSETWVLETKLKCLSTLEKTSGGRVFVKTASSVLTNEKNWVP